jgi:Spy/CpxP family protein refolding chaperone
MKSQLNILVGVALLLTAANPIWAADGPDSREAEYRKSIQFRAVKIVSGLQIRDSDKAARVRDTIAEQYYGLRAIHQARDQKVESLKTLSGSDKAAVYRALLEAKEESRPSLDRLHEQLLAKLSKELTPEQVEQVKDGMTYGGPRDSHGRGHIRRKARCFQQI